MTVAYRSFLDHRARNRRHTELEDLSDARSPDPSRQAERSEERCRLNGALAGLPEPIRAVFVLHYTGGLTLRETAKAMEISSGTVKSRLNNGLKRLRRALS
jgi:RNA polymerase sigma-70 factor (ECF subfamily)